MKKPMVDTMMKEKYDDLYTPGKAVDPILHVIMEGFFPKKPVLWEPCDKGVSLISKIAREKSYKVISTCIPDFDFLVEDPEFEYDMIITNPPYSLKEQFIQRCYELGKPWALLLPLTALEGINRGEMFRKYGVSLMVLDRRLDFTGKKSNWFNASWFYWGIGEDKNKVTFVHI